MALREIVAGAVLIGTGAIGIGVSETCMALYESNPQRRSEYENSIRSFGGFVDESYNIVREKYASGGVPVLLDISRAALPAYILPEDKDERTQLLAMGLLEVACVLTMLSGLGAMSYQDPL